MKLILSQLDPGSKNSMTGRSIYKRIINFIWPMLLPMLLAVVPTLYHYGNNAEKLTLYSLFRMLAFNLLLVIVFYLVFAAFNHFRPASTANATFVFIIFFNVYGLVYRWLINMDIIRIKHYTLLPLVLMLTIYSMFLITRLTDLASVNVWKNLVLVVSVLVIFNVAKIVPAELGKLKNEKTHASSDVKSMASSDNHAPDIYYIILDEFAGFQAMREYWHYEGVDDFANFLKDRGFFVAEESHGSSTDTLHEMATRLNYQEYPIGDEYIQTEFNDIADNRVMRYLKSRGYTTVVFDETKMGYPSSKSIQADYLFEYGSSSISQNGGGVLGFYFDEFGDLVMDNTMFYVISDKYKKNSPLVHQHEDMVYFTVDHVSDKDIPSPKFVYVHLLLPHAPFVFSKNGNVTDYSHIDNWNYYLDNYIFSIKIAEEMLTRILSESDPQNPPVIIIQSDHGARNLPTHIGSNVLLPGYPEEFKTLILFAFYMPGYDYGNLPQEINPINTFPIVFNYLFDLNIELYP